MDSDKKQAKPPLDADEPFTLHLDDYYLSSKDDGKPENPPPEIPSEKSLPLSWKCLFAFTRLTHVPPLFFAVLSSVASAGFRTSSAIILGKIFNVVTKFGQGNEGSDVLLSQTSKWCLALIGLGLGNWLASSAYLAAWIVFGELQAKRVRRELFSKLLARQLAWFDSLDHGISSLLVRIQTQTRELQLATSQVLGSVVWNALVSLASLGVAFYFSWKLTLVLLATIPIMLVALSLATRRLEPAIQAQKHELQTASKLSTASINAIDLVKVFNGFESELRQYCQAVERAGRQYLVQAQCNGSQMGFVSAWLVALFLVGFLYGVVLVNQGMKPGDVLTTFYSTLAALQGIQALLPHWLVLSKGIAAGHFLSSIAAESDAENEAKFSGSLKLHHCVGDIDLTDVSFAYPSNPSRTVLDTASFSFPAGELSFIVGRSGSGKSTIGNLIAKLYEPTQGIVWLDGQPMDAYDVQWLRSHITLIQQSSILFNDTIYNNIAVGHPDMEHATSKEILSACEFALLQSTLSTLPNGLETPIGANGHRLSGGQRQRLALARARLRDPTVLILDEVTSNLDQISRTLIMDAIREWRRDKTTIIITHDVNQIHDDDFVYVMEDSKLVQRGLKKTLLQLEGPFATMDLPSQMGPDPSSFNGMTPELSRRSSLDGPQTAWGRSVIDKFRLSMQMARPREPRNRRFSRRPIDPFPATVFSEQLEEAIYASEVKGFDDSEFDEDYAAHIFGAAERRENIPELRRSSALERLPPIPEDLVQQHQNPHGSLWATLATVWPTLSPAMRALFIFAIIVCVIGGAGTAVFAFCFAKLLGAMWSTGDKIADGRKWAVYLAIVAVVDGTTTFLGHYLSEVVAQAWVNSIRAEAMKRILRQPKSWFDREETSASRISECLERNSEEMRNVVGRFIPNISFAISVLLFSTIWALVVSWKLTLVALSPLPVVVAALKAYSTMSKKWETKCNKGAEEASACLNEIFVNIRVVRALTLEKHFREKYDALVSRTVILGYKRASYTCGLYGFYESITYPVMALVFFYAATLLAKNTELNTTKVLQVVNLLLFSIGNATELLSGLPQLTMAQATAKQLLDYAEMPTDESSPASDILPRYKIDTPLPIEVKDLSFAYPQNPKEQVLHGISFSIRPRSCTAIVGRSGCGKSTLVSLLMGLYAPTSPHQLAFANVSHSHLDTQHLRSRMAYVSQTPFLFPASVADNIAYGLPDGSPLRGAAHVHAAARAVGLHDFIASLPLGYATPLGDGGLSLSGGQAQRLSIARALVRQPQLLVMDEPTSALDAASSAALRDTIAAIAGRCGARETESDMAIVLVTHSRDMMQVAGNILMVEGGVVVQEGSYESLMQAGGPFRHLVKGGQS